MAQLTLKFKDLVLKDVDLADQGRTIGREPGNDVIVENLLVSGYHARIDPAGKDYILTDLQSKNGTFVNGERVTSAKLRDGDHILIGKHTLVFTLDPAESQEGQNLVEATMFLEVAQGASEAPFSAAKATSDSEVGAAAERQGLLVFLSGGTDEYEIAKKLVKLGKGADMDIRIAGFFTPKVAATISRRPAGYHLTPMGRAKVKVNGKSVKGSSRLKEFDIIEIGPARIQFVYKG
jgi:predicted component of type VI protein secretion system